MGVRLRNFPLGSCLRSIGRRPIRLINLNLFIALEPELMHTRVYIDHEFAFWFTIVRSMVDYLAT